MKLVELYNLVVEEKGIDDNGGRQPTKQGYYTVKGTDEEGKEWDYIHYPSGFQKYSTTLNKIADELRHYKKGIGVSKEVKEFAKQQLEVVNKLIRDLDSLDSTIKINKK
jgi:hypothetical protein